MSFEELRRYGKDRRLLIGLPLLLLAASSAVYYAVQRTRELSPEALSSRVLLFVLLNINLILILGILFVLLRGVFKLLLDRRRRILGSRFRTKLVITYVATSLLPILLLFVVATDLLRVSVDRWFNMPVSTVLLNSRRIADAAQEGAVRQAERAARDLALAVAESSSSGLTLTEVLRRHDVQYLQLHRDGTTGQRIASPGAPVGELLGRDADFLARVRRDGKAQKLNAVRSGKWIRAAVAVPGASGEIAIAGVFLPAATSRMIDESIAAHQSFQQLESQRQALKASQTAIFLTVTLSILFGTLWTAIFVSRKITEPIHALAAGTRSLARGDFSHRIELEAADEFGDLIRSFNQMAGQLEEQREALVDSNQGMQSVNQSLAEERALLSTVLQSVGTGIIAFSDRMELLSVNRAALEILQIQEPRLGAGIAEVFPDELKGLSDYVAQAPSSEGRRREITLIRGGELRYLEVSASRLHEAGDTHGWVVAVEDLTQLVQAQKLAAWNEAARRIAHEIKNPLTPIQLSAERIARKFERGDADLAEAVREGSRTIVDEVGQLKRMVDEFSRFARMPAVHLELTDLVPILTQVCNLYGEVKNGVQVRAEVEPGLQAVVDREQIRRALINLLNNAIEATQAGEIVLKARKRGRNLVIEVADPGRGVPDADKDKLFLPYFSTKGRGTGLGLAIVHRIVSDHDGTIAVHDNRPAGTTFEIQIPA